MNVRLLRKIAKVIQEKPREFDMRWLHSQADRPVYFLGDEDFFACGTAHCICGWAATFYKDRNIQNNPRGREKLGISCAEASRLFFVGGWPQNFRKRYEKAKRATTKAKIAAARIEHFIKTGGEE